MMQDDNQPSQVNNKKLFLGSLPWSLTQEALTELASQYGEVVEAVIITDKYSGRSKGFGFVEYTTDEAAAEAVEALNESEIDGRQIFVNIAKPKAPRSDRPRRSFDRNDRRDNDRNDRRGGDRY
jgi:RNA recognition motif-containing protein